MSEPRHEAVLAAAMLGVLKANRWMTMPLVIDVNLALARLRADGGVRVERGEAVLFARGFMDRASEEKGWDVPDLDEVDESSLAHLLGVAYDHVSMEVRP